MNITQFLPHGPVGVHVLSVPLAQTQIEGPLGHSTSIRSQVGGGSTALAFLIKDMDPSSLGEIDRVSDAIKKRMVRQVTKKLFMTKTFQV